LMFFDHWSYSTQLGRTKPKISRERHWIKPEFAERLSRST